MNAFDYLGKPIVEGKDAIRAGDKQFIKVKIIKILSDHKIQILSEYSTQPAITYSNRIMML